MWLTQRLNAKNLLSDLYFCLQPRMVGLSDLLGQQRTDLPLEDPADPSAVLLLEFGFPQSFLVIAPRQLGLLHSIP
ncbi:MAG: hypothetical protein WBO24_00810 [Nitrospirales bacterium]